METLHVRAEYSTIELLMGVINKISKEGQEIEILDNTVYNQEQKMIFQALLEEQNGQIFEHDKLWNDLSHLNDEIEIGMKSGISDKSHDEIIAEIKAKYVH